MAETDPRLEQTGKAEGRAACSSCLRVLIFSGDRPRFCGYCGAPLDPSSVTQVDLASELTRDLSPADETTDYIPRRPAADEVFPECVAGYRLVRRLGTGGMGTVFEAVDERQGISVALKLISPRNLGSEEAVRRFRQEGRTASAVTHPRCVFVLAVDEDGGRPYLVMELMPGTTLQSLVEERGPLPPAEAIPRVLDVIEGLAEFHKLGMIHRDVKPSNCFLDHDGRVKIGDFGLSKTLDGGADLTRTGAFLGTPLYASPEQIKREPLDERTDVYSTAATLYYLLTGRAPVLAHDAAEALARIVSEPAPPLRSFAPGAARSLEAVIHKGLERDRSRRWRDLREFHEALLPFVPERVDMASIGLRIGAYAIDLALFYIGVWAAFALIFLYHRGVLLDAWDFNDRHARAIEIIDAAVWIVYFAVMEGLFATSAGKWIVGLKVADAGDGDAPGLRRGMIRATIFVLLTGLGTEFFDSIFPHDALSPGSRKSHTMLLLALNLIGTAVVLAPMRPRTGFRGLHELLSGTHVVKVMRAQRARRLGGAGAPRSSARRSAGDSSVVGGHAHDQVGPYRIQGAFRTVDGREILSGQDELLGRRVWLAIREPGTASPCDAPRRLINRLTRPRWVGGGEDHGVCWDAFVAPTGRPLSEIVASGGLPWRDVLPILTDLSEELEAARGDGCFPERLPVDSVWVQPDGRVQFVDLLIPPGADESAGLGEEARSFAFLRDVARLALEGGRPTHRRLSLAKLGRRDEGKDRIRGPVPERAGVMLDRLTGHLAPYPRLSALRADLIAAADRPTEVRAGRRALQLLIHAFLLSPGLLLLVGLSCPELEPGMIPWDLEILAAIPSTWVVWSMLTRGGVSYPLAGLALAGKDGRAAGPVACGLRSLLVWTPPTVLFLATQRLQYLSPDDVAPAWAIWLSGVLILVGYLAIALAFPSRGPHDRLCSTAVVPI